MKLLIIFLFTSLLRGECQQDSLIIHGKIPRADDGMKVEIRGNGNKIAEGFIENEEFNLTGFLNHPEYCRISISHDYESGKNNRHKVKFFEYSFFAENGTILFDAVHIDSMPPSFTRNQVDKEQYVTIKGSNSNEIYDKYRKLTFPDRIEKEKLERELYHLEFEIKNASIDEILKLKKSCLKIQNRISDITWKFIRENNFPGVSLHLAKQINLKPFTFTRKELEEFYFLVSNLNDTVKEKERFLNELKELFNYTRHQSYYDIILANEEDDEKLLSNLLNEEKYTLIDFWASWCGPCRASIPYLEYIYENYKNVLDIISVSTDKKENDWKKALEEENMEWSQYLAKKETLKIASEKFGLKYLPTMYLLNPAGEIISSSSDVGDILMILENL